MNLATTSNKVNSARSRGNLQDIGNTPMMSFETLSTSTTSIFAKAEWMQLGGSIKARAAWAIIRDAITRGKLHQNIHLLDASSGNTAIAYGAICKSLGLNATICLPENASLGRIEALTDLNVDIVLTSPFEGTEGAQEKARELIAADPDKYFYADQYNNANNWQAHYDTTALEILSQTKQTMTHFVAALGTTGTFTGTVRRLMQEGNFRYIALQPNSPMHIMEGWKHMETARIPGIYDSSLHDEVIAVSSEETVDMMRQLEKDTGVRYSPSSAANLVGAKYVADQVKEGVIVTVLPDSIKRYRTLEVEIFES